MFQNIPPITKNLLILNALFFAAKYIVYYMGIDLGSLLGAYYPFSENFKSYQILTHMFMHGDEMHFFFNMFGLWMFGGNVERALGEKRYVILYFLAGLGAFAFFNLTNYFEAQSLIDSYSISADQLNVIEKLQPGGYLENKAFKDLTDIYSTPMVGASGALFGILIAFAMLFPNAILMLIFPPIPLKAKYFIPIYILIEIYLAYNSTPGDNVAHYAHVGGALIGFILLKIWGVKRLN